MSPFPPFSPSFPPSRREKEEENSLFFARRPADCFFPFLHSITVDLLPSSRVQRENCLSPSFCPGLERGRHAACFSPPTRTDSSPFPPGSKLTPFLRPASRNGSFLSPIIRPRWLSPPRKVKGESPFPSASQGQGYPPFQHLNPFLA